MYSQSSSCEAKDQKPNTTRVVKIEYEVKGEKRKSVLDTLEEEEEKNNIKENSDSCSYSIKVSTNSLLVSLILDIIHCLTQIK